MEKINYIVEHYEPILYQCFPSNIKQRVRALKKIQLDRIKVELEYHREVQELELKYAKKYEEFNEKRAKIVSGEYEPTEEDAKLPENLEDAFEETENVEFFEQYKFTKDEEKELGDKLKGVPHFWLCTLLTSPSFTDSIEDHDKPVLKYLRDIQVSYERESADLMSHTIKFLFDKNPYFTNESLTKKYTLSLAIDDKDPFSFEGYELTKIEGCKINWNANQDVTTKVVNAKQKNKHDGSTRVKAKSVERDSFFHFFNPPPYPNEKADAESEDMTMSGLASLDFELAEILRQNLVPKAAIYYSGDILDDEESDDDDDDDDDDSDLDGEQFSGNDSLDEDDDDDEDMSDSDADESASDSGKDAKKKQGKKGGKPKKSPGKK